MMRKISRFLYASILSFVFCVACVLASCADENLQESESGNFETTVPEKTYCIVLFLSDNGTEISSAQIESGEKITKPADPEKEATKTTQYKFDAWYCNGKKWDFSVDVVTENVELIAKFVVEDEYSKNIVLD